MHTITKSITTETAHRLIHYTGKCAHLHGHSYQWIVSVSADKLDDRGMVMDFSELKQAMKEIIFDVYDHATVLHRDDPLFGILVNQPAADGEPQKVVPLAVNPTAENMSMLAALDLREQGFQDVTVTVFETDNSSAGYVCP